MKFHFEDDGKVRYITFKNNANLEVTFSTFGASIYSIKFNEENMLLTPLSLSEFYKPNAYYGKTIGRVNGRIKNGEYKINDKVYKILPNEGKNLLHSGTAGISTKNFAPKYEFLPGGFKLTFVYKDDRKCPFNGRASYKVVYKIPIDKDEVIIEYFASCNEDTIFNMTNHAYFNLGNTKDCLDYSLKISASKVADIHEDLCFTDYIDVSPEVDFRSEKKVGKDISAKSLHGPKLNGYDHLYLLDEVNYEVPSAILSSDKYVVECYTDYNTIVVYNDGFPTDMEILGGGTQTLYKSITMECCSSFPEHIKKRDEFHHKIKYSFKKCI